MLSSDKFLIDEHTDHSYSEWFREILELLNDPVDEFSYPLIGRLPCECEEIGDLDCCLLPEEVHTNKSRKICNGYRRPVCIIAGCFKGSRGSGLCCAHGGGKRCQVEGCLKASRKQGMCFTHFHKKC